MVVVANFAPGPFPAFLREYVLLLIHEVHKQQSNTAWGRWGGCHGCINNAPKWGLVCKILHTKPILGVFENRLVCKILHTIPWGARERGMRRSWEAVGVGFGAVTPLRGSCVDAWYG